MDIREIFQVLSGTEHTERQLKSILTEWYIHNSYQIHESLTIRELMELALERRWITELPDGTYRISLK